MIKDYNSSSYDLDYVSNLASKIKVIATDVDGVLTDGAIFIDELMNEPFGKFSIYDGMAIDMAHKAGLKVVVISGRKSLSTEARCKKLGIDLAYTGISDKKSHMVKLVENFGFKYDEIAYIGDDIIDLGIMSLVGLKVAPKNAVYDIKSRVDYITQASGGEGALRELVELVLKSQNVYNKILATYM